MHSGRNHKTPGWNQVAYLGMKTGYFESSGWPNPTFALR